MANSIEALRQQVEQEEQRMHELVFDVVKRDDVEGLEELIEMDPDLVNIVDKEYGATPMHYAAVFSHLEILYLILEAGGNVKVKSRNEYTPLHTAASRGHSDACKLLCEYKSDVNKKGKDLQTALHLACEKGHLETVATLVEAKARLGLRDVNGKVPKELAEENEHHHIADFILSKETEIETGSKLISKHIDHLSRNQQPVTLRRKQLERKIEKEQKKISFQKEEVDFMDMFTEAIEQEEQQDKKAKRAERKKGDYVIPKGEKRAYEVSIWKGAIIIGRQTFPFRLIQSVFKSKKNQFTIQLTGGSFHDKFKIFICADVESAMKWVHILQKEMHSYQARKFTRKKPKIKKSSSMRILDHMDIEERQLVEKVPKRDLIRRSNSERILDFMDGEEVNAFKKKTTKKPKPKVKEEVVVRSRVRFADMGDHPDYPKKKEQKEQKKNDPKDQVHKGVECCCCLMKPLKGQRWKCIVCARYDLCNGCYAGGVGIHNHHRFEEIIAKGIIPWICKLCSVENDVSTNLCKICEAKMPKKHQLEFIRHQRRVLKFRVDELAKLLSKHKKGRQINKKKALPSEEDKKKYQFAYRQISKWIKQLSDNEKETKKRINDIKKGKFVITNYDKLQDQIYSILQISNSDSKIEDEDERAMIVILERPPVDGEKKAMELEFDPSTAVRKVKVKIMDLEKIPVGKQKLMYGSNELDDDEATLEEKGIDFSKLFLVIVKSFQKKYQPSAAASGKFAYGMS